MIIYDFNDLMVSSSMVIAGTRPLELKFFTHLQSSMLPKIFHTPFNKALKNIYKTFITSYNHVPHKILRNII